MQTESVMCERLADGASSLHRPAAALRPRRLPPRPKRPGPSREAVRRDALHARPHAPRRPRPARPPSPRAGDPPRWWHRPRRLRPHPGAAGTLPPVQGRSQAPPRGRGCRRGADPRARDRRRPPPA
ncbi:MAG: hypothetical protein E6G63_06985 [Actinobacteria bacterium]|nr:MAG: hypothetical protein E6G63_06985 [Actinomycetota bacterium]